MKKIILLIVLLFCTSCYNYQEVNEIAIVNGIGIDYNNNYKITFEIVDINSEQEKSYRIESCGDTLDDAFNNINKLSPKEISLSHLEVLIISKYLIDNDIDNIKNFFMNNKNITTNFYLVIANNSNEILNNKNEINSNNSKIISDYLDKRKNTNKQFDYVISSIINNKEINIPYINLTDNNLKIDEEGYQYEK